MGARPLQTLTERLRKAYDRGSVRPATAIIILILLMIIAVAGVIQLWVLFSPPG